LISITGSPNLRLAYSIKVSLLLGDAMFNPQIHRV
jgi:hypothetical protein